MTLVGNIEIIPHSEVVSRDGTSGVFYDWQIGDERAGGFETEADAVANARAFLGITSAS